jgi:hypothetical protein
MNAKVRQFYVKNQFIIVTEEDGLPVRLFQSYETIIAKIKRGQVYLDKNRWDYSKTTGRYRNLFLDETKQETERKIKTGKYILTDLNLKT